MRHGSLFSGIGGFDLAAEWLGWNNVFHCEINPFCQKVLKYYWPDSELIEDICNLDRFKKYEGTVDIISGGFPCQPFSLAGKRKGTEDDRHLWPAMLEVIKIVKPKWVVGENVYGIVNWDRGMVFSQVISDLENEGYQTQAFIIPACSKNAPHRRDRCFFIAYNNIFDRRSIERRKHGTKFVEEEFIQGKSYKKCDKDGTFADTCNKGLQGGELNEAYKGREWKQSESYGSTSELHKICGGTKNIADTGCKRLQRERRAVKELERKFRSCSTNTRYLQDSTWDNFPTQSPVCSRNDGVSSGLAGITFSKHQIESIKAYGNAVVPQVVYEIFKVINIYERRTSK